MMTNEVEKEIEDMQKFCEKLKADIKEQKKEDKDLEKLNKEYSEDVGRAISIIGKQDKLLFLITRLNWDEKTMKKDQQIKGIESVAEVI